MALNHNQIASGTRMVAIYDRIKNKRMKKITGCLTLALLILQNISSAQSFLNSSIEEYAIRGAVALVNVLLQPLQYAGTTQE